MEYKSARKLQKGVKVFLERKQRSMAVVAVHDHPELKSCDVDLAYPEGHILRGVHYTRIFRHRADPSTGRPASGS